MFIYNLDLLFSAITSANAEVNVIAESKRLVQQILNSKFNLLQNISSSQSVQYLPPSFHRSSFVTIGGTRHQTVHIYSIASIFHGLRLKG
jgi:hypothetical protein